MNLTLFMQVLPKAGLGWLGVFAVTIIIVAAVELKPFPLAEICRRWGFLKEGRSMAQPQCGKSLS